MQDKKTSLARWLRCLIFASLRLRGATVPLGISVAHLPNNGSVAQLYSASDFGSEGWGLESLRGHKREPSMKVLGFLFLVRSKFI